MTAARALGDLVEAINDRHGTVNSATSGYHETITAAYARLIADFLAAPVPVASSSGSGTDLEARVVALLASPLADRAALFRFWSRERLLSPEARAVWLPPDLAPLRWPSP